MAELSKSVALVTGATGFIGGHLAQRLIDEGWTVKLLVRDPDRLSLALRKACHVVVGRLEDVDTLRGAVRDADVIFHCAANVSTWDSWQSYHAVNVLGVENLLHAISDENANLSRLIHFSTVDVYGYPTDPCDEQSKTSGDGFGYGESKLLGETLVREFCGRKSIPYTIFRPANVIGPGSQFIARIGDELKSGIMLKINSGSANAGLLYIDNLLDYALWTAGSDKAIGQCYNLRDAYDVTWNTFIDRFRQEIKGRGVVLDLPFPLANAIAYVTEAFYRTFLPRREPLLHRLLVRMFGRTCGHSAEKIRAHSNQAGRIGYEEAMKRSSEWFQETRSIR